MVLGADWGRRAWVRGYWFREKVSFMSLSDNARLPQVYEISEGRQSPSDQDYTNAWNIYQFGWYVMDRCAQASPLKRHLGLPAVALKPNSHPPRKGTYNVTFPNRLLRDGAATKVFRDPGEPRVRSIDDIRIQLESAIRKSRGTEAPNKEGRIAIRRMMASYWDNSSPFSMDLVGAVIRQGTFVQKMHEIDWLHSPALRSTMERLILKYERFFHIMGAHRYNVAVPTLDVDLAW